ncbi:BZIP domain class transcription factor [Hibiscus syriacus]|uniref:BZIP domain class transcription factor n=1 Tax=Hibiscus syriacus TaxID=106335 RepID=A0A6A3AR52_HIBSY|nr:BZIP domain class transcription factor [Hibiscus syriacus]
MESLYAKLYDKYDKLKKRKLSEMDDMHREQEEKFLNYVRVAEELIQHLRSENDKLNAEVQRQAMCRLSKLLIEESQKCKVLSEEVTRLQNLHQKGHAKGGNRDNNDDKKRSRKSAAETEDSIVTPNSANGRVTASSAMTKYIPEKALSCEVLPHVQLPDAVKALVQMPLIMEIVTIQPNVDNKTEVEEAELVYRVLSLGTFERVAPEWMRDAIMFSTNMCPVFSRD